MFIVNWELSSKQKGDKMRIKLMQVEDDNEQKRKYQKICVCNKVKTYDKINLLREKKIKLPNVNLIMVY